MEKILLTADKRSESGKGSARSLRRAGKLPAVVYSEGDSTPIQIDTKIMTKLVTTGVAEHSLITVKLNEDGSKTSEHPVLMKDYQMDPVSDELLHVDFMKVSLKDKITVTVPVNVTKRPVGVKMGGILQNVLREVEVECLPTQIPESIDVDAEFVDIGGTLHVSDLPVPEGVKMVTDPEEVILSVTAPVVEEEKPAEEAAAEAAEPEVVGAKGKEEGEEKKEEEGK